MAKKLTIQRYESNAVAHWPAQGRALVPFQ